MSLSKKGGRKHKYSHKESPDLSVASIFSTISDDKSLSLFNTIANTGYSRPDGRSMEDNQVLKSRMNLTG